MLHKNAALVHVVGVLRFDPVKIFLAVKILVDRLWREVVESYGLLRAPYLRMNIVMVVAEPL